MWPLEDSSREIMTLGKTEGVTNPWEVARGVILSWVV